MRFDKDESMEAIREEEMANQPGELLDISEVVPQKKYSINGFELAEGERILKLVNKNVKAKYNKGDKRILFYTIYKSCQNPYNAEPYRFIGRLVYGREVLLDLDIMMKVEHFDPLWIKSSVHFPKDFEFGYTAKEGADLAYSLLSEHIDDAYAGDKIILCGYGNHASDDVLMRKWIGDRFATLFYSSSMDIKGILSAYLPVVMDEAKSFGFETAAFTLVKKCDMTKINKPYYRILLLEAMYFSTFAMVTSIERKTILKRELKSKKRFYNNVRIYNI